MGSDVTFGQIVLLWIGRTALLSLIAALLGWLGISVLDVLTPKIRQRRRVGESPISAGMFVGGFMIMIGLVIHGVVTGPASTRKSTSLLGPESPRATEPNKRILDTPCFAAMRRISSRLS